MRTRLIHCAVWNDDKFPFEGKDIQLMWFHLMTTPQSNIIGCFKAPLGGLADEIHWPIKTYTQTFQEGIGKGFWRYDFRHFVVLFPNHFRYNIPDNPNMLKSWLKCLLDIPACATKDECIQILRGHAEVWGEKYLNVTPNVTPNVADTMPQTLSISISKSKSNSKSKKEGESEGEILTENHATVPWLVERWNTIEGVKKSNGTFDDDILKKVRSRIQQHRDKAWWDETFFPIVTRSPYLKGQVDDWAATLGWACGPQNMAKILDQQYVRQEGAFRGQDKRGPSGGDEWLQKRREAREEREVDITPEGSHD